MKPMNASKTLRTLICTAIFGAVSAGITAQSAFADPADVPSVTVKFSDLNVSNQAGAAQLYSRIRIAANSVCSAFNGRDAEASAHLQACVDQAIAGAVAKVNQPMLSNLYALKKGIMVPVRLASLQTR